MNRIVWDLMRPQDIEIRPAGEKEGKTRFLLYQNSRNTMDALDRNFGEFGWQIKYKDVGGQIYGCLSIKDPETGEWITKEDTGDKSNISEDKGQSSDILKRCAVRFGYGRELYSAPEILLFINKYSKLHVSDIAYNEDRAIIKLIIADSFGKTVFDYSTAIDNKKTMLNEGNDKQYPIKHSKKPSEEEFRGFCNEKYVETKKSGATEDTLNYVKGFGTYYLKKLGDWEGEFNSQRLYDNWIKKRKIS